MIYLGFMWHDRFENVHLFSSWFISLTFLRPSNKSNLCLGIQFTRSRSTIKNWNVAFLTFHNLSSQSKCIFISSILTLLNMQLSSHCIYLIFYLFLSHMQKSTKIARYTLHDALPTFGLTTYNLKGSILNLLEASYSREINSLLKAAYVWLKSLKVEVHHDYNHFVKDGKQWIEK